MEMEIKITMMYHSIPNMMAIIKIQKLTNGDEMQRRGTLTCTCGAVNYYSYYGKWYGNFSKL
jgi:hypothetical protein